MSTGTSPALMSNYGRMDIVFERGEGPYLYTADGRQYFDALCGIAVCGLGHAHPDVARALAEQAARLVHTSNLYRIEKQEHLAEKLTALAGLERVFFGNSGAEANEAAIKIARKFGHEKGVERPAVIVMDGSFHGRTLATLSATGNPKVHKGFEPLVEGFVRVPFDDIDAAGEAATRAEVVAILVEPVEGEGGIVLPQARYLAALRKICDERDMLLMIDEVQTGMARTGRWFGFQHDDIVPDVITLAKGLGNGVPIGACVARGVAAEVLQPGTHGSTFGGNPLVSAAALAVIEVIERDGLVARAAELGRRLQQGFRARLGGHAGVREVRGLGLMLAIVLDRPCGELVRLALDAGLLINVTADNVVRLLPPLILSDAQADELVERLGQVIEDFLGASA
ncbi:MAG: acetylornithine transaminase [Gammaproteobacteria bacterium]|nr:acetylornithine transaminase [Gammaproteobacteria bacterium]